MEWLETDSLGYSKRRQSKAYSFGMDFETRPDMDRTTAFVVDRAIDKAYVRLECFDMDTRC